MKAFIFPKWVLHSFVIILFISYEVTFLYASGYQSSILNILPYYIFDISYFYLTATIIFPLWKNKGIMAVLLLVTESALYFACVSILSVIIFPVKTGYKIFGYTFDAFDTVKNIYRCAYLLGISVAYWLGRKSIKQSKELYELNISKLELEIAYLRSQANPHFAFNILNTLRKDIELVAPDQALNLGKLTEMMYYAYIPAEMDGKVLLTEELQQIKNYLDLQHYRYKNRITLNYIFTSDEDESEVRIPPLSLYVPIENIFKYGNINDERHPATVKIVLKNGVLSLQTTNSKSKAIGFKSKHSTGLSNLRMRLEHYYPEKFTMAVNDANNHFILDLKIEL